jgi:hypothetical protein
MEVGEGGGEYFFVLYPVWRTFLTDGEKIYYKNKTFSDGGCGGRIYNRTTLEMLVNAMMMREESSHFFYT